jgi:hypothetical protein
MKPCSVCSHPELRGITSDLMARVPYRTIERKYSVSRSAIDRHVTHHVTKAFRQLAAAEQTLAESATIAEPVLAEMRKLNSRALRILADAEAAKDHPTALQAIRECRRNLELIAKLTGELDPRAAGETPGGGLNVTILYQTIQKQNGPEMLRAPSPEMPRAVIPSPVVASLPGPEGDGGGKC